MAVLAELRRRARQLQAETLALYFAARDPRTPWYAKCVAAGVVAYAISPVDLIPDFVPVLGYLDDPVVVPAGIALSLRLVPRAVLADCRARAHDALAGDRPVSWIAGAVVVGIWLALAGLCGWWACKTFATAP